MTGWGKDGQGASEEAGTRVVAVRASQIG